MTEENDEAVHDESTALSAENSTGAPEPESAELIDPDPTYDPDSVAEEETAVDSTTETDDPEPVESGFIEEVKDLFGDVKRYFHSSASTSEHRSANAHAAHAALVGASSHGYGWVKDEPDERDLKYDPSKEAVTTVPASSGILPGRLPAIWNQLQLGSCTAHGSLRAFVHWLIKNNITLPPAPPAVPGNGTPAPFSRLQQYYNERVIEGDVSTDAGAQVRTALKALAKYGVAPETAWPYNPALFAQAPPQNAVSQARKDLVFKYHSLSPTGEIGGPETIALHNGKVIVFGFNVPAYFEDGSWDPTTQPLPVPPPGYDNWIGGHCVAATYYNYSDEPVDGPYWTQQPGKFLVIDNSWDTTWGIGGRFLMDAAWFTNENASSFWVIDSAE